MSTKDATETQPIIFSGIQPTGLVHIGNYLGALSQWANYQHTHNCVFCVVDLHAITIPEALDPARLREQSLETAALCHAAGIDLEKNLFYIQSMCQAEHSSLAWMLTCLTPLGWLERMTQFKSKGEQTGAVGSGLLNYPILQAADILLYDADRVPVGDDQRQHIEFTRDLAARFNHMFGDVFVLPDPLIPEVGARVMGLNEPTVKMSKSLAAENSGHAVSILDEPKAILKKFSRAVTDNSRVISFADSEAGVKNLLGIYKAFTKKSETEIEAEFEGQGYGQLKKTVGEAVVDGLEPVRRRYAEISDARDHLRDCLRANADKAREQARKKVEAVNAAMGVTGPS